MTSSMLKLPVAVALVCYVMILASCGLGDGIAVLEGNRLFESGRIDESMTRYLRAGDTAVARFNLGNAFAALGQDDIADSHLSAAATAAAATATAVDATLAVMAMYNRGVIAYRHRAFTRAADFFDLALAGAAVLADEDGEAEWLAIECARAAELARNEAGRSTATSVVQGGLFGVGSVDGTSRPVAFSMYPDDPVLTGSPSDRPEGVDH